MGGLARILKMYGRMTVSDGKKTVNYVWDYANDCHTTQAEMPFGSERHKASERARYAQIKADMDAQNMEELMKL